MTPQLLFSRGVNDITDFLLHGVNDTSEFNFGLEGYIQSNDKVSTKKKICGYPDKFADQIFYATIPL